ncbi:hypothetical protein FKR81_37325 [Lentzea tibetensis]|uniref:RAMA domain-containing protein n=1 Tax=Lentzea tibetensis TaxID=2591470 RepID=A0A563EHD2_9PSEU|nr:hypothetical protein [Lentzea tibetensis]TWP46037.1 hypothetical protein FKR81_37325 [Lentzea tibetensis]
MTTGSDAVRPHQVAAAATNADLPTDETGTRAGTPQLDQESEMLWQEGLPPDAMILAPALAATPMPHPEQGWAILVLAVDVLDDTDPDREGEVALFAGCWLPEQPAAHLCDGDLVLVLTEPDDDPFQDDCDDRVDVEMLLAHRNRWQRVGEWPALDARWPWIVAPTAAAVMSLHTDATEVAAHHASVAPPSARPFHGWGGNIGIVDLVTAGLVQPGEEFIWDRPGHGARHTARIQPDGTLLLVDGRTFVNPSGAITALGGRHQNGWTAWKRTADGRALGDLRAALRAQRGLPIEPRRR